MSRSTSKLQTYEKGFGYYEISLFISLLVTSLGLLPIFVLNNFAMTMYLNSYQRFGLQSRAFIGTIFSLFTDKITAQQIYVVSLVAFILFLTLVSLLLGAFIRRSPSEIRTSVVLFVFLFVTAPWSITNLMGLGFGTFDVYLFIISLLILCFLKHPYLRWGIPFLTLIAMAIHHGFFFSFFPALAILLLYEAHQNYTNNRCVAGYILFLVTCLTAVALFFSFPHHTQIPFSNVNELIDYLSDYADFELHPQALDGLFFAPIAEIYFDLVQPFMRLYALPYGITILFFSLPLITVFFCFWKNMVKCADEVFLKLIFVLCALEYLTFLPIAYSVTDWDRYGNIIMSCQFILMFYFIHSRVPGALNSVQKIGLFFQNHPLLFFLIIIFFCSIKYSVVTTEFTAFAGNEAIKDLELKYFESRNIDVFIKPLF